MTEEITTTPDYKALLGRKILKLKTLYPYTPIQIGRPVMIFEGYWVKQYAHGYAAELRSLEWRIAPVEDETVLQMYREGIYKLVGVGVVFDEINSYLPEYHVAVQDDIQTDFFDDTLPF